jgi:phenylacetyl-CoA:acceptor oxidoreductase 27-kDa subunit
MGQNTEQQLIRWGMVIDLRRCVGCGACAVVCGRTNRVSTNLWRRVVDCGVSGPPERKRACLPMSCMHCDDPPCLEVCPTRATFKRPNGIVDIDEEVCIGCGYCILACPYGARAIIFNRDYDLEEEVISESGVTNSQRVNHIGVCTKCNFCLPRVENGIAKGMRPGIDQEASPACVINCSAKALYFGNLEDPDSEVSQLIKNNKTSCLQEERGTGPSIYYIPD